MENRSNEAFDKAKESLEFSWEVHRQAFGPILEPAFVENQQVRIPLIAALNHISRREVKQGLEILKSLQEHCIYDEDKAAWTFFVGLSFEMAGQKEQMLKWYEEAGKFGHRFYLPYLKIAKAAHSGGQLEKALNYYAIGISCLHEMREEKDEVILGSAYANMTSCLTMLYRYEEAEKAWTAALQYPQQPASNATAAILYAAMGREDVCNAYLQKLKKQMPALVPQTQQIAQQILKGEHPHFNEQ